MGLFWSRGALAQVYFLFGSYPVYSGSVTPTAGLSGLVALVPAVRRMLHHVLGLGVMHLREIGGEDRAARAAAASSGSKEASSNTPQDRKLPVALAHAGVVQIVRGDGQHIGEEDVVDPVLQLLHPEEIVLQVVHGRHVGRRRPEGWSWSSASCRRRAR